MTRLLPRSFAMGLLAAVSIALMSGCVAPYPGYGYGNVAVGADYYEPYGFDYGGWGPGYYVGPGRRGGFARGGGPHAFRGAPAGRRMPSLPGGRGGGRGGRGHGGGGGRR
jgi:hypothetical protein